jgi:hypothetical protein
LRHSAEGKPGHVGAEDKNKRRMDGSDQKCQPSWMLGKVAHQPALAQGLDNTEISSEPPFGPWLVCCISLFHGCGPLEAAITLASTSLAC